MNEQVIQEKERYRLFLEAIVQDNYDVVKWFIDCEGVDVDCCDDNGDIAIRYAHDGDVKELLCQKICFKDLFTNVVNHGHFDLARWLINEELMSCSYFSGADTALHVCAEKGHFDLVKWLERSG
mmetsp:Transcript_4100/g.8848  ORF Transcript_4100/g.8848 Transcript_4100/m.8848 type:complete len:124 (+) Transcript_4100:121-492(+)